MTPGYTRIGWMRRLLQPGAYSDATDVAANRELAYHIFGTRNVEFNEPHGLFLSLIHGLVEVLVPDPKEKRDE